MRSLAYLLMPILLLPCFQVAWSLPDLYVESTTVWPDPAAVDQEVSLTATIRNLGPDPAGAFTGQFSINGEAYGSLVQFDQGLAAGASTTGQRIWVPAAPGSYAIGFSVDPSDAVTEANESASSNHRNITMAVALLLPDLVITSVELAPDYPEPGEDVRIRVVVRNQGNATMRGSFWVEFLVDGLPQGGVPLEVYGTLDAGEEVELVTEWVPAAAGVYSVSFVADNLDYVRETDETNNQLGLTVEVLEPGRQEIAVNPAELDFGVQCVDYPRRINVTRIWNAGTSLLSIESISLASGGGGTFSIVWIGPDAPPLTLPPGESCRVLVGFDDVLADVDRYTDSLRIVSDDPDNPIVEVGLIGETTTHSGATTLESVEPGGNSTGEFYFAFYVDGNVTDCSSPYAFNIDYWRVNVSEDYPTILLEARVEDTSCYAQMVLEIRSVSSPERLHVYEVIVAPQRSSNATIESCWENGTPRQEFTLGEDLYVTGKGYAPTSRYAIHLVDDVKFWLDNMPIPDGLQATSLVTSDAEGIIPPTIIRTGLETAGRYDVVLDVNGNGYYDEGIDALDDGDGGSTGGFTISEEPSLLVAMMVCLAVLLLPSSIFLSPIRGFKV